MIDVRRYGAAGDGVADDAPAVQAALDAGAGGWVFVPAGVYRLGTLPLRVGASTRVTLAPGARLVRDHNESILVNADAGDSPGGYDGRGGIVVEGGVWDMRGIHRPAYACALAFAHATGVTVRDVTVLDVPGWHGIEVNACRTVRVRDSRFLGFTHSGNRGNSEAIQVDAATGAGAYPWNGAYDATPCDDVHVVGCTFGASKSAGSWPAGVGSHNAGSESHTGIQVSRCTIDDPGDAGVRTFKWVNAVISNNLIRGGSGDGIVTTNGTYYTDVRGNQVFDVGRHGVSIEGGSQITVRCNTVIGSGASVHNVYDGIRLADVSLASVTDNRVRRRSGGNAARYGMYLDAACSSCQRHGNDVRASGVSATLRDLSGAASNGLDLT